jgi:hypothetical protein
MEPKAALVKLILTDGFSVCAGVEIAGFHTFL